MSECPDCAHCDTCCGSERVCDGEDCLGFDVAEFVCRPCSTDYCHQCWAIHQAWHAGHDPDPAQGTLLKP